MSKTPNYDAKIKPILDVLQPGERICAITGEKWMMGEEEIGWYKKFNMPPSKLSQNTRWKWEAYYDIGYQFWWNKHFDTGKPVLSFHHPATGVRVLPDKEWHARDFSNIQKPLDLNRPFFDQMQALLREVPMPATFNKEEPENSIALFSFGDRDSYFTFACRSARSFFLIGAFDVEDTSAVFLSSESSKSHSVLHSHRIYNCRYVRESFDCMDSVFLFDCRNCKNCFGASNKRNAEYVWFNEQLSKSEWERRRAEVDLGSRRVVEDHMRHFEKLLLEESVWPESFNFGSEDAIGDYLNQATRCYYCFDSEKGAVDNYWSAWMYGAPTQNAFCWGAVNSSECYLCVSSPESSRLKCSYRSTRCEQSEYLFGCIDCVNCFGCIGIKNKQFCILNKQYSEEDYWNLVDQLKCQLLEDGSYGEYFPTTMATTYVPENGAVLYAGASESDMRALGGLVFDPESEGATGKDRVDLAMARRVEEIPDSIDDLSDDWIGVPIYDSHTKRTFAFLKPEVEYYRKMRIAPPAEHFVLRMKQLSDVGQKAQFIHKHCSACSKEIVVSVNLRYPDRKIYCRDCYLTYLENR
ncbi:MAG: hypothetical protein O2877_00795 [bacterium]|nr:hypothetical protein [bacterium]